MKRYINTALLYAIFAMAGGVFYAVISGIAGSGHILLGVSMVLLLVQIKRSVSAEKV